MASYEEALSSGRGRKPKGPPELDHLRVEEAENGGHVVEHHFEHNGPYVEPEKHVFGKPEGKPKLPDGHVLHHIAKHMNIPHETIGAEAEKESEGEMAEEGEPE